MLDPHFERENQIALPPLGLLAPLAAGETRAGLQEALAMTDALRNESPRMLEEHKRIRAACGTRTNRGGDPGAHAPGRPLADFGAIGEQWRDVVGVGALARRVRSGGPMSAVVHPRVVEHLQRLRLGFVAERLDAILNEAAKREPTYLDFLDQMLRQEVEAKQRKRVAMGVQVAHLPSVKTLEEFEFKLQPSIDQRLVRELATGRFISAAENVLIFGPPVRPHYWPRLRKPRAAASSPIACSSTRSRSCS